VVGDTGDGRTALALSRELRPDIVILETNLPELNGIDATRQLAIESPGMATIVISAVSDFHHITDILHSGARGLVLVDGGLSEIEAAITASAAGHVYLSPAVEDRIVASLDRSSRLSSSVLTAREREVVQLIAEGKSTREVAKALGVSTKTIETHRQHVMAKLQIRGVAQLTKYASRNGITSLS
jgi:DNA-binding NarL/FixJ family response regulator